MDDVLLCKFCRVDERSVALDGKVFDFYLCEECESIVCHMCVQTSMKTGRDYCLYCMRNLQYEGRWK